MNKQEKLFFAALSEDRADSADVLEKPSINVEDSVVEKYSDQAHFIYELLQNADDVHARVRFILEPTRLIFAHNGTEHFSLSDPDPVKEKSDRKAGTLGHINAITSIGNSNKPKAKIGKFGVVFKAVFQYTATLHIYDPNFRFKIERFIVPIQLDEDFPARHPDETLFVFPFDHPKREAVEAYKDISDKLRNLSFPLLFLSSLKGIEFEFGNVIGLYGKSKRKTYSFDGITAEHICLTQNDGDDLTVCLPSDFPFNLQFLAGGANDGNH